MLFLSNLNINFTQEIIVCISEMLYSYHLMHILMHLCCYINYMLGVVSNNLAWCKYDSFVCDWFVSIKRLKFKANYVVKTIEAS